MTRAQKHMRKVAQIPCLICEITGLANDSPAEVHHLFDSSSRSDYLVASLCPEHHRGPTGFHGLGEREFNRRYGTTETHLLALTLERLAK